MKKQTVLALALVLLAAAGCGKNADGGAAKQPPVAGGGGSTTSGGGTNGGGTSTGGNTGGTTTPPKQQDSKPQYEKKDLTGLKVGDTAKIGPLEIKLTNIVVKKKAPGLPPNTNLAYVLVLVNIKNTGTDEYPINLTEHFKFFNVEDKSYVMSTPATNTEQNRLTGTVKAGETKEGYIGYMPSLKAGVNKFVFQHPDWGTATFDYNS